MTGEQEGPQQLVPRGTGSQLITAGSLQLPNAQGDQRSAQCDVMDIIQCSSDVRIVMYSGCLGCRSELLRGPLYYVLVLMAATVVYWRDSPVGVVAMSLMCGGDGLADVVGRRLGQGNPLPWNPAKSWAGSAAMLVGEALPLQSTHTLHTTSGKTSCVHPS